MKTKRMKPAVRVLRDKTGGIVIVNTDQPDYAALYVTGAISQYYRGSMFTPHLTMQQLLDIGYRELR